MLKVNFIRPNLMILVMNRLPSSTVHVMKIVQTGALAPLTAAQQKGPGDPVSGTRIPQATEIGKLMGAKDYFNRATGARPHFVTLVVQAHTRGGGDR